MSKAPNSPSQSRSRTRSYSRSHSRSRSRSRSRKHRYSSRSRSRSRSHSPSTRDRSYPSRDYQGGRGYTRGYNRGFRRPYYYNNRGRGRPYYPRGRGYQRGGGGGNYGYRANNWQGYRDQGQYDHHSHSPRRGRSRSRSPRKRSSRSRSRYSERSSSGRSHRSSSSSRSSSPRRRSSASHKSKDVKSKGSPATEPQGAPGNEGAAPAPTPAPEEPTKSKWDNLTDYEGSPKHGSPQGRPPSRSVPTATSGAQPEVKVSLAGNGGGSMWRTVGPAGAGPSPPKPNTSSGFGFFSKEDMKAGEKTAISTAFKKFLAEHKKKPGVDHDDDSHDGDLGSGERERERERSSSKSKGVFEMDAAYGSSKPDKALPFLETGLEEEYVKDRKPEEEPKHKSSKATFPAYERPDERFGKWSAAPRGGGAAEDEEAAHDLEHMEEELYRSRKHSSRKEEKAAKKKEKKKNRMSPTSPSPPRGPEAGGRPVFPVGREESPPHRSTGKKDSELNFSIKAFTEEADSFLGPVCKDRPLFRDLHPKKEQEFRSIFQHVQAAQLRRSPSELFAQHIVTIVHHIKAQHFRSSGMTLNERFALYQRRAAQMEMMKPRKSPEIHRRIDVSPSAFKKHPQLFEDMDESSYKDHSRKHEVDPVDLRLDIERRKKYPLKEREHRREGGQGSGGSRGPSRSPDKSSKGHHKKSKKIKKRRDRSPSSSSSSSSAASFRGRDYEAEEMEHVEGGSHVKARLGPREFPPSSGDRGPRDYEGYMESRGRGGFDRGRAGYDRGFPRMRARGWNRGSYPGNNSNNGNPPNMPGPMRPPDEEWDPEYTPKSRKYYLHDDRDRDRDGEGKWTEGRGRGRGLYPRSRGRFIYRKGAGSSPKWTHDMFQGSAEEGELPEDGAELNHKDEDKPADAAAAKL